MGTPQLIVAILLALRVLITINKHGLPREDKYNVYEVILDVALFVWLLGLGGFWTQQSI